MALETGQVFAGYEIVSTLGTGGMGEVYLGQHPRLGPDCLFLRALSRLHRLRSLWVELGYTHQSAGLEPRWVQQ